MLHLITHLFTNLDFLIFQLGCLAIWSPKGVMVAKKYLNNAFINNNDGAGFAIAKDGKIEMHKGYFEFDKFWKDLQPLQKYPMVIHTRIATHGKVEKDNCHPFLMCDGKYALVHNGILPMSPPRGTLESDTAHFTNNILATMIERIPWKLPQFTELVEEAIGIGNKIVILRADGEPWIFHEDTGWWKNGSWFSNTSYATVFKSYNTDWRSRGYGSYYNHMREDSEFSDDYHPITSEEAHVARWLKDQERKAQNVYDIPPVTC